MHSLDAPPIFIIGPPRTGTTLLAYRLAAGGDILALSESFQMRAMLPDWRVQRIFSWYQRRFRHRVPWPRRCTPEQHLDWMRQVATVNDFDFVIIKEVFHDIGLKPPWCNFELLDRMTSGDAQVVAIVRHPCDSAASTIWLFRLLLFGMVGRLARWRWPTAPRFENDDEIVQWSAANWAHFADWARRRQLYVIRYEDLAKQPEATLRRVCDHTGLPWHPRMLTRRNKPRAFGGIGDPKTLLHPFRPISSRPVGRGRLLTREQWDTVEAACGPAAAEYGYDFDRPD